MDSKRITIDIEGKKVTCFFSGNHFYTILLKTFDTKTLTKALTGNLSTTELLDLLPEIFYCGYKAQCKIKNESPVIGYVAFHQHILTQDPSSGKSFLNKFIQLFNS